MNKITINGQTFKVSGSKVRSMDGRIFVDGDVVTSGLSGDVNIRWEGK